MAYDRRIDLMKDMSEEHEPDEIRPTDPHELLHDIEHRLAANGLSLSEKATEVFATTFAKSIALNTDVYSDSYLYGVIRSQSIAVPVFENLQLNVLGLRNTAVHSLKTTGIDKWDEITHPESYSKNSWLITPCVRRAHKEGRSQIFSSDILLSLIQHSLQVLSHDFGTSSASQRKRLLQDSSSYGDYGNFFHMILNNKGVTLENLESEVRKIRHFEPFVERVNYCLSIEKEKYVIRPFNFFTACGLFHNEVNPDERIYLAKIQRPLKLPLFFAEELEELNWLINNPHSTEHDLQRFFERYPKFLLGTEYKDLHSQVILTSDDRSALIPDFLLERIGSNYCDIIDLKKPNARLLTGPRNRRGFTRHLTMALNQLREYRNYFDDLANRNAFHKKYGLQAYRPRIMVIIGRSRDFYNEMERTTVSDEYRNIQVLTYDDIAARAKRMALVSR